MQIITNNVTLTTVDMDNEQFYLTCIIFWQLGNLGNAFCVPYKISIKYIYIAKPQLEEILRPIAAQLLVRSLPCFPTVKIN